MRILRNVFQKKGRALLTIFGVSIGVFSLIVMGALSEKITLLVDGGVRYYGDKVTVSAGDTMGGYTEAPLSIAKINEIEAVEGVAGADGTIMMMFDTEQSGVSMGIPPMITGGTIDHEDLESFKVTYSKGRGLTADDVGKAVVGADMVGKTGAELGKTITVRGHEFEVVGIMDKTLTAPDMTVMIPLSDIQMIFAESLPEIIKQSLNPSTLLTGITVYIKEGYDPESMATTINEQVEGVKATGPAMFKKQIKESTAMLSAIIYAIALISLLVGGLSVINTMSMSIAERTREIGIRKAIGGSDRSIITQFVLESATIGLIAGVFGIILGWALTSALNAAGNASGTQLFLLTSRLVLGSLSFSVILGIISGLIPAIHAARMNPVEALRYE